MTVKRLGKKFETANLNNESLWAQRG